MKIDPVSAYDGPYSAFREEAARKCTPKDVPRCLRFVADTNGGPDPADKGDCTVRSSKPDLSGGYTFRRDEAPIRVEVVLDCSGVQPPEVGAEDGAS